MSNIDIIRAWKDPKYRDSLSEEQRSQLPENPAGLIELSETKAETVAGGGFTRGVTGKKTLLLTNPIRCYFIKR